MRKKHWKIDENVRNGLTNVFELTKIGLLVFWVVVQVGVTKCKWADSFLIVSFFLQEGKGDVLW